MNLIEAIRSGKRFRRKSLKNSWFPANQGQDKYIFQLSVEDIVAEDWEVEQVAVTITREQFTEVWGKTFGWNKPYSAATCNEIAYELGL